jgi:peptidase E
VTDRHLVAMSGGPLDPVDAIYRHVFELTGAARPRVCFLPTAQGDSADGLVQLYRAFPSRRFEPSHLSLFARGREDLRDTLLAQDVVLVPGGSTANLLALWRLHGVDAILREAWDSGVVLAGWSAGANCWFRASTTDSFGPDLRRLDDGLGFLEGSFCPHYDSEPQRRPLFHRLVGEGFPGGYGVEDRAALHFTGTELTRVIRSDPGANAYRVELGDGEAVIETRLS